MHRWYDPETGRWISEDPIGFAAGDANLYRYVGNGVTGATDPSGLIDNDHHWDFIFGHGEYEPRNAKYQMSVPRSLFKKILIRESKLTRGLNQLDENRIMGAQLERIVSRTLVIPKNRLTFRGTTPGALPDFLIYYIKAQNKPPFFKRATLGGFIEVKTGPQTITLATQANQAKRYIDVLARLPITKIAWKDRTAPNPLLLYITLADVQISADIHTYAASKRVNVDQKFLWIEYRCDDSSPVFIIDGRRVEAKSLGFKITGEEVNKMLKGE
jgi:hypothetical protein